MLSTSSSHCSYALVFPATAAGHPLTFRAAIKAGASTRNLDYPIEVIQ